MSSSSKRKGSVKTRFWNKHLNKWQKKVQEKAVREDGKKQIKDQTMKNTEINTTPSTEEAPAVESSDLLAVLTDLVDSLSTHSAACVQSHPDYGYDKGIYWLERNGEPVITECSCTCPAPYKKALSLLGRYDNPVDIANLQKGEKLAGF